MSCLLQRALADEQLYSSTVPWLLARDPNCPPLGEWLRQRPSEVACPAGSEQLSLVQARQGVVAALNGMVAGVANTFAGSDGPQHPGSTLNTSSAGPRVQLDVAAVRLAKLHGHMLMHGYTMSSSQHIVQLVKLVLNGPLQQHVADNTGHAACGQLQLDQPSHDWLKQLASCPAAGATYAGRVLEGCSKMLVLQPQTLKAALAASPHVQWYAPRAHRALQHPSTPTIPAATPARPGHYGSLRGGGGSMSGGWGAAGDGVAGGGSILADSSPGLACTPGSGAKHRAGKDTPHDSMSSGGLLKGRAPMGQAGHSPGLKPPSPYNQGMCTPAPATPGTAGARSTPGAMHTPGSGTPGSALSGRAAFSGGLSPASFRSPTPTTGGAGVPSPFPAISMPQQGSRAAPAAKVDPRHAANQEKARDLLYKLLKSVQLQLHHLQVPLEQLQAVAADAAAVKEARVLLAGVLAEAQGGMKDLMQQLLPSNLPHLADLILSCALQAASTGDAALDPQLARVAAQDPARFSKLTERLQPSQQQQQRQAGAGGRGSAGSTSKGATTGGRAARSNNSSSSRSRVGGDATGGSAGATQSVGERGAPLQQGPGQVQNPVLSAAQQLQQQEDGAVTSGWAAICRPAATAAADRRISEAAASPAAVGAAGSGAAAGRKGDRRAAPSPAARRQLQVVAVPSAPAGPFTGAEAGDTASSSGLAVSSCLSWLQAAPQAQHSLFVAVHASDSVALHQQLLGAVTRRLELLLQGPQQALVSLGQQAQVARILGLWLAYLAVTPFAAVVAAPDTAAPAAAAAAGLVADTSLPSSTWDAAGTSRDGNGCRSGPVLQLQHALDLGRLLSSSSGNAWSLLLVLPALAAYMEAVHRAAPCLLHCCAAGRLRAVVWQLLHCSALSPLHAGYQPLSACIRAQLEACWHLLDAAAAVKLGVPGEAAAAQEAANNAAGVAAARGPCNDSSAGSSSEGNQPVAAEQLELLEQGIAAAASWLDDPYWQLCMSNSISLVREVVSMSADSSSNSSDSGSKGGGSAPDKMQLPAQRTPLQPQAQPRADAGTHRSSSSSPGAFKMDTQALEKASQAPSASSQLSSPSAASESASEASGSGTTRRATATMLALRPAVQKEVPVPPALQAAVAVLRDTAKMQLQQAFLMQYSADEPIKLIDLVATVSGVLAQHALGAGLSQGVPPVLQERLEAVKQQVRTALEAQPPPAAAPAAAGGASVSDDEARRARAHESMLAVGSCVQQACTSAGPEAVSQALEAAFAAATHHISANSAAALQALAPVGLPPPVLAAATAVVQDTSNAAVAQRLLQQVPPLVGSLLEQSAADLVRQICREQAMASRMTGPLAATGSRHTSGHAAHPAGPEPAPSVEQEPAAPQCPAGGPQQGRVEPTASPACSSRADQGAEPQHTHSHMHGLAQLSSGSTPQPAAAAAAAAAKAAAADGLAADKSGAHAMQHNSPQQGVVMERLRAAAAAAAGPTQRVSKRITPVPMQAYPSPTDADAGSGGSSSTPVRGMGSPSAGGKEVVEQQAVVNQEPAAVGSAAVAGVSSGAGCIAEKPVEQREAAGGVQQGAASSLAHCSSPAAGAVDPGSGSNPASSSSSSSSRSRVQARRLADALLGAVLGEDWRQVLLLLAPAAAAAGAPVPAPGSLVRTCPLEQASEQQQQQELTQVALDVSQQLVEAIECGRVPLHQVERTLLFLIVASSAEHSNGQGPDLTVCSGTVQQQQQQQKGLGDDGTASEAGEGISRLGGAVLLLCGAFVYSFYSSPHLLHRVWCVQEPIAGNPVQGLTTLPTALVVKAKLASQHWLLCQLRKWLQQVTVLSGVPME